VRLVGPNGEQVGIVRVEDALRLAAESDLDLVEVAPMAKPPVAKLMDFGKFKYQEAIKEREARKNQVNTVIKEIKLRPKIDPHDYATKKGHVERFLKAGDKVKVTIMFRGREQSRPELGFRLLQRLAEDIGELGFVESTPKQDGRNMIMVIGPTKKKAEAKAEQRRKREEAGPGGAARVPAPVEVAAETVAAKTTVADTPVAVPEVATPEVVAPEVVAPEVVAPEVVAPEVVAPEVVAPEVAAPKAPVAKAAAPKAATPRAPVAKAVTPKAATPKAPAAKAVTPKAATPKAPAAKAVTPKAPAAKVAKPKLADTSIEAEVTVAD
jgi:translation initiation factor IF-3